MTNWNGSKGAVILPDAELKRRLRELEEHYRKKDEQVLTGPIDEIAKLGKRLAEFDEKFRQVSGGVENLRGTVLENNTKLAAVYKSMDEVMKKSLLDQDSLRAGFEGRLEAVASPLKVKLSTVVTDLANHRGFVVTSFSKIQDGIDTFHKIQDTLIHDLEEIRSVVEFMKEAYKPVPTPPVPEVKPDPAPAPSNAWVGWLTLVLLVLIGVGFAIWHRPG